VYDRCQPFVLDDEGNAEVGETSGNKVDVLQEGVDRVSLEGGRYDELRKKETTCHGSHVLMSKKFVCDANVAIGHNIGGRSPRTVTKGCGRG
jgi:hypothetical protein